MGVTELMISPALQAALVEASFASKYYELCAKYPLRTAASQKLPNAEILATLADVGSISKLKGPGRVYGISAPRLLETVDFSFIIQGAGAVIEPCLGLTENGARSGTNYSVLASSANAAQQLPAPTPAYPRPFFHSLWELHEVVSAAFELAVLVGNAVRRATPNSTLQRTASPPADL